MSDYLLSDTLSSASIKGCSIFLNLLQFHGQWTKRISYLLEIFSDCCSGIVTDLL